MENISKEVREQIFPFLKDLRTNNFWKIKEIRRKVKKEKIIVARDQAVITIKVNGENNNKAYWDKNTLEVIAIKNESSPIKTILIKIKFLGGNKSPIILFNFTSITNKTYLIINHFSKRKAEPFLRSWKRMTILHAS